ncbi:MAG: glycosyltransferase family 4 protein, partial [Pyrinomonadaceae bacterium]
IALTEFGRAKFIEGGLPAEKIIIKPNFIFGDQTIGDGSGGFALFVGRLSEEKGIETLLNAWEKIGLQNNGTKPCLKIIGDGPLAPVVKLKSKELPNIEYLGLMPRHEVYDLMGRAAFLIFPSVWYETFGRVAIEAFAKGTPVIASNIGAIAELIDHERTGLLFKAGDENALCSSIEWALANKARLDEMRKEARLEYEEKYTAEKNYEILMNVYTKAKMNCTTQAQSSRRRSV